MKMKDRTVSFSINETVSPRFDAGQIKVDRSKRVSDYGIPKHARKLKVERSGKIGYSK